MIFMMSYDKIITNHDNHSNPYPVLQTQATVDVHHRTKTVRYRFFFYLCDNMKIFQSSEFKAIALISIFFVNCVFFLINAYDIQNFS